MPLIVPLANPDNYLWLLQTDPEPLTPDHPLFSLPNCIITPHSAGLSTSYLSRAVELITENVQRVRNGRNVINEVRV